MGLKATIQSGVLAGFKALGDVRETVTHKVAGTETYDPETGAVMLPTTSYTVQAIVADFRYAEIDGEQVRLNDARLLYPQSGLGFTPTVNDEVVRADGSVWQVVRRTEDPASAHWELQIRRP